MAIVAGVVEINVGIGQCNGLCRAVDRCHPLSASSHGIDREASGVAEHVEYTATFRIVFEQRSVVALVDKKSCFLSFQPVNAETQSVFGGDVVFSRSDDILILRVEVSLIRESGL